MTKATQLFDEFNKRYWRGRLPKYRVICRGQILGELLGRCDNGAKTILLRKDLSDEDFRLTLLHEMCHIGPNVEGDAHGPRFLRKLRRLARLGEPKLLEDIERYDGTAVERIVATREQATGQKMREIPWRADLQSQLAAAANDSSASRHPWPLLRRLLAHDYRISVAELERRAPWAEGEWRRLRYTARSEVRQRQAIAEGKEPPPYRPPRKRAKATGT